MVHFSFMTTSAGATPYPEINRLLQDLDERLRVLLGAAYAGLAVHGSLALGDFNPQTSDIDLLVMTNGVLDKGQVAALRGMHAQLRAAHPRWGPHLEVSYLPLEALRRHDPAHPAYPRLAVGEELVVEPHHSDWVIQRHILREYGIRYAGPDPAALIDPVETEALRTAVLDIRWWWEEQLLDTRLLRQDAYQAYAVLSMCRMLYTLREGGIVSKPAAGRWAMAEGARPFAGLIEAALAWQPELEFGRLAETESFVRWTLDESRRLEQGWPGEDGREAGG